MINRSQSDSSSDHEEEGDHNPPAPEERHLEKGRTEGVAGRRVSQEEFA